MTQFLQHVTGNKSMKSNLGEQILNDVKDSPGYKAVLEAMKALHERNRDRYRAGEGALQLYAIKQLKEMGWDGIDGKEALSFYMKEMYRGGEGSLQVWAVCECERLGFGVVDPQEALSLLFKKGKHPLQQWAHKKCKDLGIEVRPEDAQVVYTQHKSFYRHLPVIQKLAKDKENFEVLDNNKKVFYPSKSNDKKTYDYIHDTLLRLDEDDWRKKRLSEKLDLFFDEDSWDKALPIRTTRRAKEQKSQREKAKKRELKDEKFTTGNKVNIGNNDDDITNFLKSRHR